MEGTGSWRSWEGRVRVGRVGVGEGAAGVESVVAGVSDSEVGFDTELAKTSSVPRGI